MAAWDLAGNSGTNPPTDFLGTTDSHSLVLKTNGAKALRVDMSGKVGVGTTSPTERLHVVSAVGSVSPLVLANTDATSYAQIVYRGSGRIWGEGVGNASETALGVANKWFLFDLGAVAVRMAVDTSGRVGIGTTSPGQRLTVTGMIESTSGGFKFPDASEQATAGLTGSLTSGRVPFATGTRTVADNAGLTWDNTNLGLALAKSGLNTVPLATLTPSISGSRNNLGTIDIPPLAYGSGGPQEKTLVPGLVVNVTDSTAYSTDNTNHVGAASAAVVIQKKMTGAFSAEGPNLLVQTIEERTRAASPAIEDVAYGILSFLTLNSASGTGSQDVPGINAYLQTARFSGVNTATGLAVVMSNFVNDTRSNGITLASGDAADVGTEFVNGDALLISPRNARNTADAWTNAINIPDGAGSRFKVANDGSLFNNIPSGGPATVADFRRGNKILFQVNETTSANETAAVLEFGGTLYRVKVAGNSSCAGGAGRCLYIDN